MIVVRVFLGLVFAVAGFYIGRYTAHFFHVPQPYDFAIAVLMGLFAGYSFGTPSAPYDVGGPLEPYDDY